MSPLTSPTVDQAFSVPVKLFPTGSASARALRDLLRSQSYSDGFHKGVHGL